MASVVTLFASHAVVWVDQVMGEMRVKGTGRGAECKMDKMLRMRWWTMMLLRLHRPSSFAVPGGFAPTRLILHPISAMGTCSSAS